MKRKLLSFFMALVAMAYTNVNAQIAEEVAGTYDGILNVSVGNVPQALPDQEVIITATGDEEITLAINNLEYPGIGSLGSIIVTEIKLEEENGAYTFAAEEVEIELMGGEFLLNIEGSISKEGKLDLSIEIGGEIFVDFEGYDIAKRVSGTYIGELEVTVGNAPQSLPDKEITITATGNKEITLAINNFEYPGMGSLGSIIVTEIKLEVEDDVYTFAEEGVEIELMGGEFFLDLEGSISQEGTLILSIEIGGEIFVDFEGSKESTNAINAIKDTTHLVIYPSASYDELNIEGLENSAQYAIYNIAGLAVKKGLTQSTVSISDLSKGIYIINIEGRSVKFVKK